MQLNPNEIYKECLHHLNVEKLNEMQLAFIDKATSSANLMLLAPTGSGKTIAFLLPVINRLAPDATGVQALIIAPSRELALQIENVFRSMKTSFKITCCYGGHSFQVEQNSLSEAPSVIIGTPGRLADHIHRKSFDANSIRVVVLDEFDKSLQLGFEEPLDIIFKSLKGRPQHLLTSATKLVAWPTFLPFTRPDSLNYLQDEADSKLKLKLLHTSSADKVETLMRLVASFNQEACLVFCNHRDAVNRISEVFNQHHFAHGILHGALEQIDREKNLIKFRGRAHNVLIATDLASRGLDIPEIRHVVHYQLPPQLEAFTHRNGRTARMHADGEAYLILANDETLPPYIDKSVEEIKVGNKLTLPPPPHYVCLYVSAGKKDKISKGDIVGLLTKKGQLQPDDIGLISILDFSAFVSVKRDVVKKLFALIKDEKLKKVKVKIEVAS